MKVAQLIANLENMPQDAQVEFVYSYRRPCTCGPEQNFCYCGYVEESVGIGSIELLKDGTAYRKYGDKVVLKEY